MWTLRLTSVAYGHLVTFDSTTAFADAAQDAYDGDGWLYFGIKKEVEDSTRNLLRMCSLEASGGYASYKACTDCRLFGRSRAFHAHIVVAIAVLYCRDAVEPTSVVNIACNYKCFLRCCGAGTVGFSFVTILIEEART